MESSFQLVEARASLGSLIEGETEAWCHVPKDTQLDGDEICLRGSETVPRAALLVQAREGGERRGNAL